MVLRYGIELGAEFSRKRGALLKDRQKMRFGVFNFVFADSVRDANLRRFLADTTLLGTVRIRDTDRLAFLDLGIFKHPRPQIRRESGDALLDEMRQNAIPVKDHLVPALNVVYAERNFKVDVIDGIIRKRINQVGDHMGLNLDGAMGRWHFWKGKRKTGVSLLFGVAVIIDFSLIASFYCF